ncbi:MAG TPA: hypothetical protein PLI09_13210 [Candidatus Hydrogenedentes bacterium]|nr:hypothetical protein [Candidatus Hydrogenedentota bacterium]
MEYFNYEKVAQEAGISADQLTQLCQVIEHEFPNDRMLFELHVLRACMAVVQGAVTIEEILRENDNHY